MRQEDGAFGRMHERQARALRRHINVTVEDRKTGEGGTESTQVKSGCHTFHPEEHCFGSDRPTINLTCLCLDRRWGKRGQKNQEKNPRLYQKI